MRLNHLLTSTALGLGLALAATVTATAAPISSGTLGMAFTYQAENASGANVALGSASAIDFSGLNAGAPSASNTGSFFVTQATGDFGAAGINIGDFGIIHDLIFSPFSAIASFFSVGGVSFDLNSITVDTQTDTTLGLTGQGVFHNGDDETDGVWSFSGNTNGASLTGTFSWSADASPTAVPEPASLALLGMGLFGLGVLRRRQAKA